MADQAGIGAWLAAYNTQRPHQGLAYQTPDEVYFRRPVWTGRAPSTLAVAA
ncbi:integrase core domain-containing protein [Azospirillum sp. B4]|uniref:integrase core domain-containing protein n=1 Tax=Azospirillum sp. B4 TaxID=95605 RepID=UPI000A07052B